MKLYIVIAIMILIIFLGVKLPFNIFTDYSLRDWQYWVFTISLWVSFSLIIFIYKFFLKEDTDVN